MRIGPWTLGEMLGRGGSSQVFLSHSDDPANSVALKVLVNNRHRARFIDEIKVYGAIGEHAGVLPFIGADVPDSEKEYAWLATKVAVPLASYLNAPSLREVVAAFERYSNTLAELAGMEIYHRDIKPANLYWYSDDYVVGDFGIADFPAKAGLTGVGEKLGPANFIAPEMLDHPGDASVSSGPADVYSLAKSLWAVAAGRRFPPPGELRRDRASLRLSSKISDDRAVELESLLERATNHDPSTRPTMRQLNQELRWWGQYDPVPLNVDLSTYAEQVALLTAARRAPDVEAESARDNRIWNDDLRKIYEGLTLPLQALIEPTGMKLASDPPYLENFWIPGYGGSGITYWQIDGIDGKYLIAAFHVAIPSDPPDNYASPIALARISVLDGDTRTDLLSADEPLEHVGSLRLDTLVHEWRKKLDEVLPEAVKLFISVCRA